MYFERAISPMVRALFWELVPANKRLIASETNKLFYIVFGPGPSSLFWLFQCYRLHESDVGQEVLWKSSTMSNKLDVQKFDT
jgi:hypothetical protein